MEPDDIVMCEVFTKTYFECANCGTEIEIDDCNCEDGDYVECPECYWGYELSGYGEDCWVRLDYICDDYDDDDDWEDED